jgi:hypothetical protein
MLNQDLQQRDALHFASDLPLTSASEGPHALLPAKPVEVAFSMWLMARRQPVCT